MDVAAFNAAQNNFTIGALQQLALNNSANVAFSPFIAIMTLCMAYSGAQNTTLDEYDRVFNRGKRERAHDGERRATRRDFRPSGVDFHASAFSHDLERIRYGRSSRRHQPRRAAATRIFHWQSSAARVARLRSVRRF